MARTPVFPAKLLNQTAIVFGEGGDGAISVVLNGGLPCFVGIANAAGGSAHSGGPPMRADLASSRTLVWTADYAMPKGAQVVVGLERYNVLPGSYVEVQWPLTGDLVYRACQLQMVEE
jgi:hypothetical protein